MSLNSSAPSNSALLTLAKDIKAQGRELGFQDIRICNADPEHHAQRLNAWLEKGMHGSMQYMENHAELREKPEALQAGAIRVISCRYNYLPHAEDAETILSSDNKAYVSRYALGRDYHKLLRKKLSKLCDYISEHSEFKEHRAFVDSAPVLERGFAEKAGLGWIGKNTMLINSQAGSWFFLAEILTDAPLPIDEAQTTQHCGSCTRCLEVCPTDAFVSPWQLDARKCISYLTIENKDSIPVEFREAMGNRVFGCDDCQLVCPWNKFAQFSAEQDFQPRHELDDQDLCTLFNWDEETFLEKTAGSAIRRIGYIAWLRNLSVAMGNASFDEQIMQSLLQKKNDVRFQDNSMLQEHLAWAIEQQESKRSRLR